MRICFFLLTLLLLGDCMSQPMQSTIKTVGPSWMAGCDYTTLHAALADLPAPGHYELRLLSNAVHQYTDNVRIFDKTVSISGGWSDCGANAEQLSGHYATLRSASGATTLRVFSFRDANPTDVYVSQLEILGARERGDGGGVRLSGRASLTVSSTRIADSQAFSGGGIFVEGEDASLQLGDDVEVVRNSAEVGGGIRCQHGASMLLRDVVISNNTAQTQRNLSVSNCVSHQ